MCSAQPGINCVQLPRRMPRRAARHCGRAGSAAGESGGEIGVDRLGDGLARARPPLVRDELLEVGRIGDIAEFDQHRGHVRRLEDAEAGRPQRILVQARRILELVDHRAGERGRKGLRLALREVDQNVSDIIGFGGEIDAGYDVGAVFRVGQPLRLGVGGLVGQRCRRSPHRQPPPPRASASQWIEMNNCACCAAGKPHPIRQLHEGVVRRASSPPGTCRSSPVCRAAWWRTASTRFFSCSPLRRMGAGVDAAMAGIDNDHRPRIAERIWRDRHRRGRRLEPPAAGGCRSPPRAGRSRGRPGSHRPPGGPAGPRRDRPRTPG